MLGLDRRAARYTWTVVFIFLLLGLVYLIRETLFIFAVALLFAYLLWPLVNYLDQRLPGVSRVPALAIVYLSLVGLLFVIGIEIGSRVVLQANALATRVPELLSNSNKWPNHCFTARSDGKGDSNLDPAKAARLSFARHSLALTQCSSGRSVACRKSCFHRPGADSELFLFERWPVDSPLHIGYPGRRIST